MNMLLNKNTQHGMLGLQSGGAEALGSPVYSTATTGPCNTEGCRLDFYNSTLPLTVNIKFYDETPSL